MLYGDDYGDCVCDNWETQLERDVPTGCDVVIWAGISFSQAASTEYFREVRRILIKSRERCDEGKETARVRNIVINPSKDVVSNLESSICRDAHSEIEYAFVESDAVFLRLIR